MLSSQTKDEVTTTAVANLRSVLPGGLTVSSLLAADPSVISGAIGKVSTIILILWLVLNSYFRLVSGDVKQNTCKKRRPSCGTSSAEMCHRQSTSCVRSQESARRWHFWYSRQVQHAKLQYMHLTFIDCRLHGRCKL